LMREQLHELGAEVGAQAVVVAQVDKGVALCNERAYVALHERIERRVRQRRYSHVAIISVSVMLPDHHDLRKLLREDAWEHHVIEELGAGAARDDDAGNHRCRFATAGSIFQYACASTFTSC